MPKTIEEINDKIRNGRAAVLRADEMTKLVRKVGPDEASEIVDVVTTGTFGAMCSSGVWLNFGHSDPPIRMTRVWLNNVEAYAGAAAVDAYLGATQNSDDLGLAYGGAHVIEDLINGREVVLRAVSYGTDCYPRKEILTRLKLEDLNFALMSNPRNAYQHYNAACNSSDRAISTYMGRLLPRFGNVTYSGAGELSPLMNDPLLETVGTGTRIFLGGTEGFITGPGTQHSPQNLFSTLMVQGDLKKMSSRFIRAASFPGYGCSLYVGLGIPIPVLNPKVARRTGIGDEEIAASVIDYSVPSRNRPVVRETNYAELRSGTIEIDGRSVPVSSLSSLPRARMVAETLKRWIQKGRFLLTAPVEPLPKRTVLRPLEERAVDADAVRREPTRRPADGRGPAWIRERCTSCGQCFSLCRSGAVVRNAELEIKVLAEKCVSCGLCRGACPMGARGSDNG
ncbi:MAG TPA: homocysteine biosynthesis protein [Candidatus Aminicenantes bacterium]|nr:homocysteine biosynthesis protein [Candidatus Aminicenantes bacterium]HRY66046.1 homocysteine biosynthesis protein [Candidatus Aminicenantes bacterium]HRZ72905.1 homocysteine biosynthesis protein [Candidatus Aminicenantes bacterium]